MEEYINEEGDLYTIDEINQTAKDNNTTFEDIIKRNKLGLKTKKEEVKVEVPGKPLPVAKKDAGATVKSTVSKSVKPSSVSQDNVWGKDRSQPEFLTDLQKQAKTLVPKTKDIFNAKKFAKEVASGDTDGFYTKGEKNIQRSGIKEKKLEADIVDNVFNNFETLNYAKLTPEQKLDIDDQAVQILQAKQPVGTPYNIQPADIELKVQEILTKASDKKNKIIGESYIDRLLDGVAKGADYVGESFASMPETVYRVFSAPQNIYAAISDDKSLEVTPKKFKKSIGVTNPVMDYFIDEQKRIGKKNNIYDNANYDSKSITENISNGNYSDAFRLLGSGLAESAPVSIGFMASGANMGIAKLAAASTVAMAGPEIRTQTEENPGQSEIENVITGFGMAGAESVFSAIGEGSIGKVYKDIILKEGVETGSKIFKDGLITTYQTALKKYGVPVSMLGEGLEEVATTVTQNLISKKPAFEGAMDSFVAGVGGGTVYGAPVTLQKSIQGFKAGITTYKINNQLKDSGIANIKEAFNPNTPVSEGQVNIALIPNSYKILNSQIDTDIANDKITLEEGENIKKEFSTTYHAANQLKPLELPTAVNIEVTNLLKDREKLTNIIKTVEDPTLTTFQSDKVKEINSRISDLTSNVAKEKIQKSVEQDIARTKTFLSKFGFENTTLESFDDDAKLKEYLTENTKYTEKEIDFKIKNTYGLFVPLANGEEVLIINKNLATKNFIVTTGQHEFLHKLIYAAVKDNPELQIKIGGSLYKYLEKNIGSENLQNTKFAERFEEYAKDFDKDQFDIAETQKKAKKWLARGLITNEKYTEFEEDAVFAETKLYGKFLEEVLPLLSESISSKDIVYNETFFTKIGDILRRIFQQVGLSKVNFDTGEDVFNFIRDYNKSFEKGKFTKAFESLAKEGKYKGVIKKETKAVDETIVKESKAAQKPQSELIKEKILALKENEGDYDPNEYDQEVARLEGELKRAITKETTTPTVKKEITEEDEVKELIKNERGSISSDKVQKIYEEKGFSGADEIIKLFKPITKKIVDKRRDAPGFDPELLTSEIELGDGGLLYLIKSYNPDKGVPLAAYINKNLPLRAIAASKRVLDKQFNKDASEEKGLMATETADQGFVEMAKEKQKYKNALESKVFPAKVLETATRKIITIVRTLKNRIDAPITLNRTVTPLIAEIKDEVGKQLDIDVKTMLGGKKDKVLEKELLRNKRYILENMTTTWLMGKDGQGGIPMAIQKRIDGRWINFPDWVGQKIDREKTTTDQAGRTSGAELVRRLPNVTNNISDEVFLAQIIGPDGNPLRGRKESLSKAMSEEGAFDIILDDLANEGPIFDGLKTNQARLGVEILETLSIEIAKSVERGNIKESKKVAKEVLTVLSKNNWDLNNENYKSFVENLSKADGEYVNNVLQEKSIKQLRKYLNTIDLENEEFKFKDRIISSLKDPVNNVLSKINRFELISKEASSSTSKLNDLKIKYKNNIYNFELKLENDSRLKGVVINNVTTNPIINKETGINDVIAKTLKDNANVKAYTDYLLANGGTLNANGSIKVPISIFADSRTKALQEKAQVTINTNTDFIRKLNNGTNDAITFGNAGTFSYGDTKFDGVLPIINGNVNFDITTQRGSMDADKNVNVYFIGFPKMASNWDQKSSVDIHKKPKKLLTIIRKASLLKQNIISAKATKAVLNASKPMYIAKPKKISVIDIDESLSKIKSKISYKDKNGKIKKLTIPEFLKQQIQLELDGIIFDYTDIKVEIEKNKDILNGFESKDPKSSFGITIEPIESNNAIQVLLQNIGVDVPANNINTLDDNSEQSKTEWVTSKLSDGFNDFKIAGNKFANSKGVADILNNFDVKSEKQQEQLAFFNSISTKFNKIIAKNTGIGPAISYSDIVAKRKGASKNLFDIYVPASAADFELLLYNFIGKGKEGEAQKEFFADALLKPYANGNDLMDATRQSIKNNYKALIKSFPNIAKRLEKLTPDGNFTYDQTLRVAMWNGSDMEIPGLSKSDTKKLSSLVNNDEELSAFMQGLIALGRQDGSWIKPGENWDASTIISDLHNLTEGEGRKQFLAEFIDNAEEMFGKWDNGRLTGPNMNKIEAIYGTDVRESIEDVLYRMSTGKNRAQGSDKITNAWFNWVSGSTGTIMFLNTRSAALQLIGAVNFLNLRDNNPIAAAAAFANQKQYWADFARIWNSDKMKERRGGLKEDVAAAEIANAAATSRNKPTAVVSYLLKIGYTPTQLADSFAIASGGAPFYRNRIKSYIKEGQTEAEAEKNAWNDFTKVSDETQQSGDPRDISKQQASGAGRLLLTFQNTAMQQSRIVKKSFLDLKNGRGDAKMHIAKITYYLAIQNLMFSALQQGLFAIAFTGDHGGEDEDEFDEEKKKRLKEKDKKLVEIANGVIDTVVRGTGLLGGVMVTLKNVIKKYMEEEPKKYKADYTKVLLEGVNISPPIGSKIRKVYTGLQQTKFDRDLIKERGWGVMQDGRVHLGPMYSITGKVVEATANLPMDRLVAKVENVSQAMNSQNKAWQRVMVGMGWTPRSVGIGDTEGDIKIETTAKEVRKEEGKIKGAETRARTKDSIRALPIARRIEIKREAALKRREEKIKKREAAAKKRKMG
jgi:hypothetical protein